MNKLLLASALLGFIALAGMFWLLKPEPLPTPASTAPAAAETPRVAPAPVTIEIRQGPPATETQIIQAAQGTELHLRFLSDQDTDLHLHGYDLHVRLKAGAPKDWSFVAEYSGRFEFERHGAGGAHETLAVIEVQPR